MVDMLAGNYCPTKPSRVIAQSHDAVELPFALSKTLCNARIGLASRKSFLMRIDPQVLEALRRWADDDLRSVNGQIEFVLRKALRDSGRLSPDKSSNTKRQPKRGKHPPQDS